MSQSITTKYIDKIDELLEQQKPGHTLEQAFYADPELFELEYKHIFSRQWLCTSHINSIPNKGDYFLFDIAGEEIIIVRGDGDSVYAHRNVCRHRGSRVCKEPKGHVDRLTCPYHSWSYNLDGSLQFARAMGDDFDKSEHSLHSCQVRIFEGIIYINLTPKGEGLVPDFDSMSQKILPKVEQANMRHSKIAFTSEHTVKANWKLLLENYFECYHCLAAHPEFCKIQLHHLRDSNGTPKAIARWEEFNERWVKQAEALGHPTGGVWGGTELPDDKNNYCSQYYYAERMGINDNLEEIYAELVPDAKCGIHNLPLLGSYKENDAGQVDWGIGQFGFWYTSCQMINYFRLTPISASETKVTKMLLVHPDAVEGEHYDLESLTVLGENTTAQDKEIVLNNQAGVLSRSYQPGPYSPEMETEIPPIINSYLRLLQYGRSLDRGT